MHDQSPEERLAKHRTLEAWLTYQLQQTRQAIRKLEAEVVEGERRRAVAHRESRFTVEYTWSDEEPNVMHRGACEKNPTGGDLLDPREAALMMRDRPLTACTACNPISALRAVYLTIPLPDEGA